VTTRSTSGALNVSPSVLAGRDDAGWFCLLFMHLWIVQIVTGAHGFLLSFKGPGGIQLSMLLCCDFVPLKCLKLGYTACGLRNPNTFGKMVSTSLLPFQKFIWELNISTYK
jgi:hypothetical protein